MFQFLAKDVIFVVKIFFLLLSTEEILIGGNFEKWHFTYYSLRNCLYPPPQPTPIYVNIRVFDFHINKYTGRAPYMPFKALHYLYTIGGGVFFSNL